MSVALLDCEDVAWFRDELTGARGAAAALARRIGLSEHRAGEVALALQRHATSKIASLHDLTLAARYAGRILALREGRMAGEGALTAAMIRDVFGVEARVRGEGRSVNVDFLAPVDPKEDF